MKLITLNEQDLWTETVKAFPKADVFYQAGFCKALEKAGSGKACLFSFQYNDNQLIYPFFRQELPPELSYKLNCVAPELSTAKQAKPWSDITSPYGYSGPLFAKPPRPAEVKEFLKTFHHFCQEEGIISEFIRFHPLVSNQRDFCQDLNLKAASKVVNVSLQRPVVEIWRGYGRNNRKHIKKAERSGLSFILDRDGKYFNDFYRIYLTTMLRNQAASFYYFPREFFETIHRELPGQFVYAHVAVDSQIVSTELVLLSNNTINSFLGGTLEEFFPLRPNNLLKHRIILWARAEGYENFLLGGGYHPGDGIFQFKASFATEGLKDFYIGRQVHLPAEFARLGGEGDFFPPYRRR